MRIWNNLEENSKFFQENIKYVFEAPRKEKATLLDELDNDPNCIVVFWIVKYLSPFNLFAKIAKKIQVKKGHSFVLDLGAGI